MLGHKADLPRDPISNDEAAAAEEIICLVCMRHRDSSVVANSKLIEELNAPSCRSESPKSH